MLFTVKPDWPAPTWVCALTTTRPWDCSKQHPDQRILLKQVLNLPYELPWLQQTHSACAYYVDHKTTLLGEADASWTTQIGQACVVLTGDCLPVLLCDVNGTVVGAAHGGWRGLLRGIVENTVAGMRSKTQNELIAWLGPAIGPQCFEVGVDVVEPFIEKDPFLRGAFVPLPGTEKWLGDIYKLAKLILWRVGITQVYGGEYCTYTDQARFYSARRTKTPSRMATLIWLQNSL